MGSSWNSTDSEVGVLEPPWTVRLPREEHRCSPFPMRALVPVDRSVPGPVRCWVVVILAFMICWLPFHVGRIIYINTEDSQMMYFSQYFNIVALQLFYLSTSINPILYNLISKKYRAAAWKLLRWRQSTRRGFIRSRNTEGTTGGNTAGYTNTTISISRPATSMANQIASFHSSGTSEKTGL